MPGMHLPPILHQELVDHPLLRRSKWRRKRYTMTRFLESGTLEEASEPTRRQFWQWLRQNGRTVSQHERATLANLPVWPDTAGNLRTLSELCEPRSGRIAAALASAICRPHEQVLRLRIISSGSKSGTALRRIPKQEEISTWLRTRLEQFVPGDMPDPEAIKSLQNFETDLVLMLKDADIARAIKAEKIDLPARARDGSIQWRCDLVTSSRVTDRLALCDRFVLADRSRATVLDRISPALPAPNAAALSPLFGPPEVRFFRPDHGDGLVAPP